MSSLIVNLFVHASHARLARFLGFAMLMLSASAAPGTFTITPVEITRAGSQEAFVRFAVRSDPADGRPLTGTPIKAVLRLSAGPEIVVHAATNRSATAASVSIGIPVAAGRTELDVTTGISGRGDFTFALTGEAALPADFSPTLELTVDYDEKSAYHSRTPQQVLARGREYIGRYSAPEDIARAGYFDVTKQPYGAKGDGRTDDTFAIQRAVTEARDARVAVYFPPGDYLVSDTIHAVTGTIDYGPVPAAEWEETWNVREFPCVLLGPPTGPRATLLLKDKTFTDTAAPKPVLYFWTRHNATATPWPLDTNKANSNYNQTLSHIDLDLGTGNAGAMGVSMYSAQGSHLADFTVRASGAFAGLGAGTGPGGGIYHVTVDGGRYGAWLEDGQCPLLVACAFRGQTDRSIRFVGRGTLTLVGTEIAGAGVDLASADARDPFNGTLTMADCILRLTQPGPAIRGTRPVALSNVYFENAATLVELTNPADNSPGPVLAGRAKGWSHVTTYGAGVTVVQSPIWKKGPPTAVPNWLDGTPTTKPFLAAPLAKAPPPADLLTRHAWRQNPDWRDAATVNAKAAGARGDGSADDWPALQAALDANERVFLPRGNYAISRPLRLRPGGVLFGLNATYCVLKPSLVPGNAFSDAAAPQPLVVAPADPAGAAPATTTLADVKLFQPSTAAPGSFLLDWQAGRASQVKNVSFDRRRSITRGASFTSITFPLVTISGAAAGGRWYGLWNDRAPGMLAGSRQIRVTGTRAPLRFYGLNLEHMDRDISGEFRDVANVDLYATKAEGSKTILEFKDSRAFRVFGFGGASSPEPGGANIVVRQCTDFLLASMDYQQQAERTKADATKFNRLLEETIDGRTVVTPGWEQFVLYLRGTPPF